MQGLRNVSAPEIISARYADARPTLGICIGMQILFSDSDENGLHEGIGIWKSSVRKLEAPILPHMGWNTVQFKKESNLRNEIRPNPRYYFVHSYFVECNKQEDVFCSTDYGKEFVSGFEHDNIFGLQFHPEKSHKYGMELLANFCKI